MPIDILGRHVADAGCGHLMEKFQDFLARYRGFEAGALEVFRCRHGWGKVLIAL
jgi:hypothetical protein